MSNKNDFEIVLTKYNGNEAHVVVPDCVTHIDGYAFEDCRNLTTLIISDKVKDIAYTAFLGCYNLERIKIGKGLKKVSDVGLIGDCSKFKGFEVDEENKYRTPFTYPFLFLGERTEDKKPTRGRL